MNRKERILAQLRHSTSSIHYERHAKDLSLEAGTKIPAPSRRLQHQMKSSNGLADRALSRSIGESEAESRYRHR